MKSENFIVDKDFGKKEFDPSAFDTEPEFHTGSNEAEKQGSPQKGEQGTSGESTEVQYREEEVHNRSTDTTSHNLLPVTSDESRVNDVTPSVSESSKRLDAVASEEATRGHQWKETFLPSFLSEEKREKRDDPKIAVPSRQDEPVPVEDTSRTTEGASSEKSTSVFTLSSNANQHISFAGISALSVGTYSYFSGGNPTIPTITTGMLGASASYLVSSQPAGIAGMLGSILASFQTLLWPSKPMQSFQTGLEIIGLRKFEAKQILTIFPVMHLDQIIQINDDAFREALVHINIHSLRTEMLTVAFSAFKGHLSELEDEIEDSDMSKYSRSIHRNRMGIC